MSRPLLQRNTRYLLTWLPVVLLVFSIAFYVLLRMQAHHMQEKQLLLKQRNVWTTFINQSGNINLHIDGEYDIGLVTGALADEPSELRDTVIYYADQEKSLPFQVLSRIFSWNNKNYQVTTYVSSTEISHLIIKVFIAEFIILIVLLIAIVVLGRKSSFFLWKPFFASVAQLQQYDIKKNNDIQLPEQTGTSEFDQLNKTATELTHHANIAYRQQKEFVENASHEIQTPLAIIRTKLELLISEPNLSERQAALLSELSDANERLSLMNRTLLLLAKIENNQFPETAIVNISQLLTEIVETYKSHYDNFPALSIQMAGNITVTINRSLAEVMISNLVKNAVVHNTPGGSISITLTQQELVISNTGNPVNIEPNELFDRFKKGGHDTKTTGLGLAIVSQIAHLYHYAVNYQYENNLHMVTVTFA